MVAVPVAAAGTSPGTHALIIGVSHYPFADGPDASPVGEAFGLENLTSAARSASEIAAWLLHEYRNPDRPLASLRILLSPSEGEELHPDIQALLVGDVSATRAAVEQDLLEFRNSCKANSDNFGIVYVAGHGVQLHSRGAVVLLHDFGSPDHLNELHGAIDIAGCRSGMAESGNASNQIWFSDACRQYPDYARRFERLEGALTLSEGKGRSGASLLFLASSTRERAFSQPGGTSIFNQALLWGLRGAAARGPDERSADWYVGALELARVLPDRVRALAGGYGEDQNVEITGSVLEVVAHRFHAPPDVDLLVTLLPEDAAPSPKASVVFLEAEVHTSRVWPLRHTLPAGLYILRVTADPPLVSPPMKILKVEPPGCSDVIKVI